jgi:hypothetical protein
VEFTVICDEGDFADRIAARANLARVHVGLSERVVRLGFVLDAPELEGSGFWLCESSAGGVTATLYGAMADLLPEQSPFARHHRALVAARPELDLLRVDRWMHRNLLQLDDLLRRRVEPDLIDAADAPALQVCWDVWTDGRLRAWQHPGLSLAERRALFLRTFARGTPLLPRHWEIFHALWEGRLNGHAGLTEAIRGLPRLRG